MSPQAGKEFSPEALAQFAQWAADLAEQKSTLMFPPGPKRRAKFAELQQRHYAEYVTPPDHVCPCCRRTMP